MSEIVISALALGLASLIGSLIGFLFRKIPHRLNDIFLGFCAGMMLGASIVCLILEGMEIAGPGGWWQVVIGVALGVGMISCIDFITPHLHSLTGLKEVEHHPEATKSVNSILLFVTAIAIHKFPEGLATGITFDGHDIENAWAVTITIALQNIPEGLVVVTPLLLIGVSRTRTMIVALSIAAIEIIGAFTGYYIGGISSSILPALLGLAGGAMLYVLSDEMIPETHAHGFQKEATYSLVAGVMVLLLITRFTG